MTATTQARRSSTQPSSGRLTPSLRALSIRQPFIHAILGDDDAGQPIGKAVENRDWAGCNVRGTLLLHASKTCTHAAYRSGAGFIADVLHGEGRSVTVPPLADLAQGGLVGIARIVTARRHPAAWALDGTPRRGLPAVCDCGEGCSACGGSGIRGGWEISRGWAIAGMLGLVLADVRPLPFVPLKGSRGFFPVACRGLPLAYHAAAQELDEAERQRLRPSPRGRWLLGAAAGNGTGSRQDRLPGVLVVPAELAEEAAQLHATGLLEEGPEPHLSQITQDGLKAWRSE